jgi:TetR/AcrR family tetracycline transcriptional repressor
MSRVPSPVLNRRIIADTALEMMDRDGYAAFSMPRLGDELGVRTPSLYHHFRDRADILAEVARTVVLKTEVPEQRPDEPWTEYFVELSVNFRRTILRHRNTAPVLLQFLPRDVLLARYEIAAAQLAQLSEILPSQHVLFMDGLEKLTLGSALVDAVGPSGARTAPFPTATPEAQPLLAAAVRSNEMDAEQLFVETVRAFLAGVAGKARG